MGDGRVTDIRPKTLKRIHFYDYENKNFKSFSFAQKKALLGHIIDNLDDEEKNKLSMYDENILSDFKEKLQKEVKQSELTAKTNNGKDESIKSEPFKISSNDDKLTSISFYKINDNRPIHHKDGTLINNETGELLYFVVKDDIVHESDFKNLAEGSKVTFTDMKRGVCEILLHKKEGGDFNLDSEPAIVEFVEIVRFVENPKVNI